ncbi:MAG: ABC transporter permease [Ardenticatenaceae bacterium]|nr:ABC transporter permease [Ardenticatenaceae bacterium]MCB8947433.1 ABC transporter permease [Ardenticatenaceae bacterium]
MFKKALDITWLYLKMTYSSRSVLIFQLLLPILFTFMVGQGTGGFDGPSSTVVTWPLAVANEDSGSLGTSLVDTLSADPNLDVTIIAADEAETAVTNDDALAALIIPANFSEQLAAGQQPALDFYSDPADVQEVQPIEQAVLGAASQLGGAVTAASLSRDVASELGLFAENVFEADYFVTAVSAAQTAWQNPPTAVQINEDEIVVTAENVIPQGTSQSSPGMMAMFATFTMVGGAVVLLEERQNGTLRRLLVMPIRKSTIMVGKLLGILLSGLVQMVILILFGALVFGIPWGNAPLALGIMVLSFALAITALGLMFAALSRTLAQANALGTIVVLSISALGGAWWPLDIVPGWMQTLGRLSPISWAMDGFHDIITRGLGVTAVLPEAGILLAFAAVFLAVGVWRFRYE